jgi:hypothetical protein
MKQPIKKLTNASETCEIASRKGPEKPSTAAKIDRAAPLPLELESASKSKLITREQSKRSAQ